MYRDDAVFFNKEMNNNWNFNFIQIASLDIPTKFSLVETPMKLIH